MKLKTISQELLNNKSFWASKNVLLPGYSRINTPVKALSFSPGKMGFGHLGDIIQDLLNSGSDAGMIAGVETFSQDYYNSLAASDWLATQIIIGDEKGYAIPKIQGAFATMLFLNNNQNSLSWSRFIDFALNPEIQYATINAPENVYGMAFDSGNFAEPTSNIVKDDMVNGTLNSDPAKWTKFAVVRYKAGLKFALVSCTNFSKNGYFTGATVRTIAKSWEDRGFAPKGFVDYLLDGKKFSFPNCMIDRIAIPQDDKTINLINDLGVNSNIIVTEKTRYWALEDNFPAGRPDFEKAEGVFMCENFSEVKKYEDMKLRILNMSHSVMAGLGVLLGYRGNYGIYNAFNDKDINTIINKIVDIVIEVIDAPRNLSPRGFAENAFERLNNPNMPDDPMRIAFNASTKILPRFMDTYFDGLKRGIPEDKLKVILLPVAGFIRYTIGIDDTGAKYELENDPMINLIRSCSSKAKLGEPQTSNAFSQIISNKHIMGKNLYEVGETGEVLQNIVGLMLDGTNAVRKTLNNILKEIYLS